MVGVGFGLFCFRAGGLWLLVVCGLLRLVLRIWFVVCGLLRLVLRIWFVVAVLI